MKKLFIILTLIFPDLIVCGQNKIELQINNPEPRVGDEVKLTLDANFLIDEIKIQSDTTIKFVTSSFGLNSSEFSTAIEFSKSGSYLLGPYEFIFNGKKFISDSIKVNVKEMLPYEEGIWVRFVPAGESRYIIVEQLIENKSDFKTRKDGFTYTVGGVAVEDFAEIIEVSDDKVEIDFRSSRQNNRVPKDSELFSPGFSYSFRKYEIKFLNGFEGPFKLEKKHFTNFPKKGKFKTIEIR